MENQRIIISGFVGGTISALFNSVPFLNFINLFCCLGIMVGGAVALIYYDRSEQLRDVISPALAITLGITSGIIAAFLSLFIEWLIYINYGHWEVELLRSLLEKMDDIPLALEELFSEIERGSSYGFLWTSILFRNLFLMPVFCMIGALITRLYINKNRIPLEHE